VADGGSPLSQRLREFPPLARAKLWPAHFEAITNLEKSFAAGRPRALIQMATGSGKTFKAVNFIYRLVKYGGVNQMAFGRVALPKKVWLLICFEPVVADGHDFLKVFTDGLTAGTIREWLHPMLWQ
jgi:predicted helicase